MENHLFPAISALVFILFFLLVFLCICELLLPKKEYFFYKCSRRYFIYITLFVLLFLLSIVAYCTQTHEPQKDSIIISILTGALASMLIYTMTSSLNSDEDKTNISLLKEIAQCHIISCKIKELCISKQKNEAYFDEIQEKISLFKFKLDICSRIASYHKLSFFPIIHISFQFIQHLEYKIKHKADIDIDTFQSIDAVHMFLHDGLPCFDEGIDIPNYADLHKINKEYHKLHKTQ